MIDYSIFPTWMGIHNIADIILAIISFVLLGFAYVLSGYGTCPKSFNTQIKRMIWISFWPICLVLEFILLPFRMIYEFSKL